MHFRTVALQRLPVKMVRVTLVSSTDVVFRTFDIIFLHVRRLLGQLFKLLCYVLYATGVIERWHRDDTRTATHLKSFDICISR